MTLKLTTTVKNWLTTVGGSILMGALGYLAAHEPSIDDPWSKWKTAMLTAVIAGALQTYHAYQPKSGKQEGSSDAPPGGGVPEAPVTKRELHFSKLPYRFMPMQTRTAYFTIAFKRLVGVLALISVIAYAIGANCNGTISAQTQAQINAAEVLGACIEGEYAVDSEKTPAMNPAAIAIDIATVCGADVPDLVTTFTGSTNAGMQGIVKAAQDPATSSQVHAAALVKRPALLPLKPVPAS